MSVASAPGPVYGAVRPESPFVGLVPFDEKDAPFFFGRGQEAAIVAANLRSTRLTILYGPSGVGKSSLLMAGAVHELREEARTAAGESPFAVCVFSSWRGDPVLGLEEAARAALVELGELGAADASLAGTLRSWTADTGTLLVVLDQFEEYFQYHPDEDDGERLSGFAAELTRLVNDPSLPVHVLLSIREDALAKLDRFEGHIPSLFSNYLRVEHLDHAAAQRAIEGPIDAWNRLLPAGEAAYEIEPALVEEVITAAVGGRLVFAVDGDAVSADAARDRVEAPFLQLVLERLWRDAVDRGDRKLTRARLEELGGARRIVENHLLDALGRLTPAEQAVAADAFRFLVTRSKTKIAHPASDLADWSGHPEPEVQAVLDRLTGAESGRILRAVAPAVDDGRGESYELFHDVLADPILDWRRVYEQERERRRVRRRFFRNGAILLAAIVLVGAVGFYLLRQQAQTSKAHAAAEQARLATLWIRVVDAANAQLDSRLPESLRLALEANRFNESLEARNAMTLALEAARKNGVSAALAGHTGDVGSVAFSPDGQRIVAGSSDGTVRLWDARTRRLLQTLTTARATGAVNTVAFSRDGRTVAGGGSDGRIRLWAVGVPRTPGVLNAPDSIYGVAFSPGGRMLAGGGADGTVRLWDLRRRALLRIDDASGPVTSVAFSPDSRLLAAACAGGAVDGWDAYTGQRMFRLTGLGSSVNGVAFSADGRLLASAGADGTVRIVDVRHGSVLRTLVAPRGSVFAGVAVSRTGTVAAAGSDGSMWLWSLDTGAPLGTLKGEDKAVRTLAFSPDGRVLATGSTVVRIWDLAGRQQALGSSVDSLRSRGYHGLAIWSASRLGTAAALDSDGVVRLFSPESGARMQTALSRVRPRISAIAFTPDGQLAVGGADGTVRLWDGTRFGPGTHRFGHQPIYGLAVSPDGRTLAAVNLGPKVGLLDLRTRGNGQVAVPGRGAPGSVAFAPDGRTLATGGKDGTVRFWDLAAHTQVRSFATGQGYVYGIAFSPDGRTLATSGQDGTVRLWDVETLEPLGEPLTPPSGSTSPVTGVAFSPDGRTLVSASLDGTVRAWTGILWSSLDDLQRQVCGLVAAGLPEQVWRSEWATLAPGLEYPSHPCGALPNFERPPSTDSPTLATIYRAGVIRVAIGSDATAPIAEFALRYFRFLAQSWALKLSVTTATQADIDAGLGKAFDVAVTGDPKLIGKYVGFPLLEDGAGVVWSALRPADAAFGAALESFLAASVASGDYRTIYTSALGVEPNYTALRPVLFGG